MLQAGCLAGFVKKTLNGLSLCPFGFEHFEGNFAVERGVAGFVDHGKTAASDLREELVFADTLGWVHGKPRLAQVSVTFIF